MFNKQIVSQRIVHDTSTHQSVQRFYGKGSTLLTNQNEVCEVLTPLLPS